MPPARQVDLADDAAFDELLPGYGAPIPPGYELMSADAIGTDRVELWVKTQAIACDAESSR